MAYIYPAPGVAGTQTTLSLALANETDDGYTLPAMQDVTVNAANDVFTWTQLDAGSKLQVATTATNSLSFNIVVDQDAFFGSTGATSAAEVKGVFGMSTDKDLVEFELYLGDTSEGGDGKIISAQGYITGLAPTVSADSPVWVTPITITITGDYTVSDPTP